MGRVCWPWRAPCAAAASASITASALASSSSAEMPRPNPLRFSAIKPSFVVSGLRRLGAAQALAADHFAGQFQIGLAA